MTGGEAAAAPPAVPGVDDDVAARYGRPAQSAGARRRRLVAAAAAVAVLLVVFVWFATSVTERDVRWQTVTFVVTDDESAEVTFEVYGREGDRVRCLVRVAADDFADVGQRELDLGPLPPGGTLRATTTVRTIAPGANASVRTCVVLPDRLS